MNNIILESDIFVCKYIKNLPVLEIFGESKFEIEELKKQILENQLSAARHKKLLASLNLHIVEWADQVPGTCAMDDLKEIMQEHRNG